MAKLNFSLPDEVKREFNELFADVNKSALLTRLVVQAIEEKKQVERRKQAVERLLERRKTAPSMSTAEFQALREELRQ